MIQNHPMPGWPGRTIPATRGAPERGPANPGPANSDSPIHDATVHHARDGTPVRIRDDTEIRIPVSHTGRHNRGGIAVGFNSPNLQGFGNLEGLKTRCQSENTAPRGAAHPGLPGNFYKHLIPLESYDGTPVRIRNDTEIRIPVSHTGRHNRAGIAVGFSQRNRHTHAITGLQPHQQEMRLKPDLPRCILTRQLPPCRRSRKQTAMEKLHGSPNLQGFGNLEGLKTRCQSENTAPRGVAHPGLPSNFYKHLIPLESCDGMPVRIRDDTEIRIPVSHTGRYNQAGIAVSIAVGFSQRNRHTHAITGLQPHQEEIRLKTDLPRCILTRQLPACRRSRKQTAMDKLHGSPNLQGFGNLEGLKTRCSRTGRRDGTRYVTKRIPEGLHVYSFVDIAMHRNKLLAEAFYLRGDIEKFGTGFFRIQSELKNSPEVSFKLETLNGFTRSGLEVVSQDTAQDDLTKIPVNQKRKTTKTNLKNDNEKQ